MDNSEIVDNSEIDKSPKTDAEKDESQKKKIEPDMSEAKNPTSEKIIELYDPGKYYLKD